MFEMAPHRAELRYRRHRTSPRPDLRGPSLPETHLPPESDSSSSISTTVTALVAADAQVAFRFLADPLALGGWSLGCMGTQPDGRDGLYRGRSLFDGAVGWFEIEPH